MLLVPINLDKASYAIHLKDLILLICLFILLGPKVLKASDKIGGGILAIIFFIFGASLCATMLHKTFLNDVWCSVWGWVGGVWGSL